MARCFTGYVYVHVHYYIPCTCTYTPMYTMNAAFVMLLLADPIGCERERTSNGSQESSNCNGRQQITLHEYDSGEEICTVQGTNGYCS